MIVRYSVVLWVWFSENTVRERNAILQLTLKPLMAVMDQLMYHQGEFCRSSRYCLCCRAIIIVDFIDMSSKYWCFSQTHYKWVYFTQHNQLFHIRTNLLCSRVALLSRSHHPDKCALLTRTVCGLHCMWNSECSRLDNMSHSSSHSWVWEASHKTPLKEQ